MLPPSYLAGGIGVGIGTTFVYWLSHCLGIGANINVAYSFANPFDNPATMASSGLKIFGGVGLAF
jgi:hypothetical protein